MDAAATVERADEAATSVDLDRGCPGVPDRVGHDHLRVDGRQQGRIVAFALRRNSHLV